jgi:oleate hydratase
MKNYDRINAVPPEGIERKHAHIVGGGIAGLATGVFLVDEAHMPGENVTIYEAAALNGGCLDAAWDAKSAAFRNRGSRMFERRYECLSYLMERIPSTQTPGRTLLDETFQANVDYPTRAGLRLMEKQGKKHSSTGPLMPPADGQKMLELMLTPEEQLEGLSVGEWFSPEMFKSDFWYYWAYIFALAPQHSLIECRRYLARFAMYVGKPLLELRMIIHTQYNEYDSIVQPVEAWLKDKGVRFKMATPVRDIETENQGKETLATALVYHDASGRQRIPLTRDDLVFFTNGSMVTNTNWGDNDTVATYNRDTQDLGVWDVWKKLAARDPKFGRPDPFISDIDKSAFHTFTMTVGDPTFAEYMSEKTGVSAPLIKNGCITIVDSNWMITFFVYGKKYYRDQPDDVDIVHGYILFTDRPGDFIKKPARECTGNEIFSELLYHCGLEDKIPQILARSRVAIAAMPYITSEFMPRHIADRPKVIPDGCVNLAFIGQYVETPADVSFTVESSVRTAMMAVWGLTGLEKPQIPMYEPLFDIRVIAKSLELATGSDKLNLAILKRVRSATGGTIERLLDGAVQRIPEPDVLGAVAEPEPAPAASAVKRVPPSVAEPSRARRDQKKPQR